MRVRRPEDKVAQRAEGRVRGARRAGPQGREQRRAVALDGGVERRRLEVRVSVRVVSAAGARWRQRGAGVGAVAQEETDEVKVRGERSEVEGAHSQLCQLSDRGAGLLSVRGARLLSDTGARLMSIRPGWWGY